MEKNLKIFLANLRPRDTRELVQDHLTRLDLAAAEKRVTLHVDKRYAFNAIVGQDHIQQVVASVKRAFGAECSTTVKLDSARSLPEREKAVPHAIHYH
ncbi:MAG: hypothetical protein HYY24_28500 [Verrucomicrobia bacterium]|nr:hypothetical protein [Verrucomicrobiota bacterium]